MTRKIEPLEVVSYKAPGELRNALFEVARKLSKPDKPVTMSSFTCEVLMKHPLVVAELKRQRREAKKLAATT